MPPLSFRPDNNLDQSALAAAEAPAIPAIAWFVHPSDMAPLCHAQPAHAPYPIVLAASETPGKPSPAGARPATRSGRSLDDFLLDCGAHALVPPHGTPHRCQVYGLALTAEEWLDMTFHEALDLVAGSIGRIRAASGAAFIGVGTWTAIHLDTSCSPLLHAHQPPQRKSLAAAALHLHAQAAGLQILDLPGAMGRAAAIQLDRHADPLILLDPEQLSAQVLALACAFTHPATGASLGLDRVTPLVSDPPPHRTAIPVHLTRPSPPIAPVGAPAPAARRHPSHRPCPAHALARRRHVRLQLSPRLAPRQRRHPV